MDHFHRCCVEEVMQMVKEGDVAEVSVGDLDIEKLKAVTLSCTDFLLDIGFDVFDAIGRYLGGSFNDDLRLWLKNNQDSMKEKLQVGLKSSFFIGEDSGISLFQVDLLVRFTSEWLDSLVKRRSAQFLPMSNAFRKALKLRIIVWMR